MRHFIISAATVLLLVSCKQKEESNFLTPVSDVLAENLKGDVTKVEIDTYLIDSTGKTGPLDEKTIEEFDAKGYTASYTSKTGKDSLKYASQFVHDNNGLMLSMETKGPNGIKRSSLTVDYDSIGKPLVAKGYDSSGKLETYYADVNTNQFNQVTTYKGYHPDSTLKLSYENMYDSVYYTGSESKDSVGKVTYSSKTKLNDKKDPEEQKETTVSKDSTTDKVTTFKYTAWDSHGNWTDQTQYNEKGKPIKLVKRIIEYKQ